MVFDDKIKWLAGETRDRGIRFFHGGINDMRASPRRRGASLRHRLPEPSLTGPARRASPRPPAARGRPAAGVDEPAPASRNANDFLAIALGSDIIAGTYPPGALLPNESELLDRFNVSRPTLREAFRVLAAKGLIVSRRKVGTRVRAKADWNMLDPDILAWHLEAARTEDFVADLFQLREMVEPPAAALAARGRDAATLERIAAAYADMERYRNGSGDLIGADLRFHQAILEASGNHFIKALGGLIKTALIGSFKIGWRSPAVMQDSRLLQHGAVMDAIRDQDPEAAQACMAVLLRDSMEDVRQALRDA